MLRLRVGHRLRLEHRPAAKPARQPIEQHLDVRGIRLRVAAPLLAEERLLAAGDRPRGDHLHRDRLHLAGQMHPGEPKLDELDQMLHRRARPEEPNIDYDRRRDAHLGRMTASSTCERSRLEPHLQCRHPVAADGQRCDAPPHEAVDHRADRVERGGRRRKPAFGRREGVVAEGVERLLAGSQEFRNPPLELLAKTRCEALPRQPKKLPDRRDAELREARDRLLADRFLPEGRDGHRRQLRRLLPGWNDAKPSPTGNIPAMARLGRNDATRRCGSNARGRGRIRHGRTDTQPPRSECPHRRANDRLLATEEPGSARDVHVNPLGPIRRLNRHDR